MPSINLLPPQVLVRRGRRRRIRIWTVAIVVSAGLSALPVARNLWLRAGVQRLQLQSNQRAAEIRAIKRELSQVSAAQGELARRIEYSKALRVKRSWWGLLATLARALPDRAWLAVLATVPSAPSPGAAVSAEVRGPGASAGDGPVCPSPHALDLVGYADKHEDIMEFIERVNVSFPKVEMASMKLEPWNGQQAVRFELRCSW